MLFKFIKIRQEGYNQTILSICRPIQVSKEASAKQAASYRHLSSSIWKEIELDV